ncbi:MAG: LysM peptidoglycan-binding domain-containing protein [Sedimentisphaerales bacterium]|nr:LysM peptidoglycan-binding domain-containing protein [Sedimentisphaerales bacterium]
MRSELKIGLIVGVLLATGLIIYLVNQDRAVTDSAPDITLPQEESEFPDETEPATATAVTVEPPVAPNKPVVSADQAVQPGLPAVEVDAAVEPTVPQETVIPAVNEKPVAPVVEPEPVVTPSEPEIPPARYYTVKSGDNLYRISELYFGEGRFWKIILDANPNVISNPDVIKEGWKLRIPYPEEVANQQ